MSAADLPGSNDLLQQEVIAFLSTPEAYGGRCDQVERIDTPISTVFLAGDRAFRLKRAVRLPDVNYATLERRRACCEREVELNRRTASAIYLGAVPVTRTAGGALAIGGTGAAVEWLVEMRRVPRDTRLEALAEWGVLHPGVVAEAARAAAGLHAMAARRPDHGGAAGMRAVIDDNRVDMARDGDLFEPAAVDRLHADSAAMLKRCGMLLDARRADGWVRECHGDLRLRNICLIDGRPVLFHAIEFSDRLSHIDVLYDFALLLAELLQRELLEHANSALNVWMERLSQYEALALLPLFLSARAATRARTLAAAAAAAGAEESGRLRDDARSCFTGALRFVQPGAGAILAVGGLSGAGKTTLAKRLAAGLGQPPGALVLRSEVARKRLFGVDDNARQPPPAYDPSVARSIYRLAAREAYDVSHAGYVAIVDATLGLEEWRHEIRRAAERAGVPFVGFWLEAPFDVLERRVRENRGEASDAAMRVLRQQWRVSSPPADWVRLDASAKADDVAAAATTAWAAAQTGV